MFYTSMIAKHSDDLKSLSKSVNKILHKTFSITLSDNTSISLLVNDFVTYLSEKIANILSGLVATKMPRVSPPFNKYFKFKNLKSKI